MLTALNSCSGTGWDVGREVSRSAGGDRNQRVRVSNCRYIFRDAENAAPPHPHRIVLLLPCFLPVRSRPSWSCTQAISFPTPMCVGGLISKRRTQFFRQLLSCIGNFRAPDDYFKDKINCYLNGSALTIFFGSTLIAY